MNPGYSSNATDKRPGQQADRGRCSFWIDSILQADIEAYEVDKFVSTLPHHAHPPNYRAG